ncbi:MAG: CoA transferase, partial [Alphaproteobacteria bacterium]
PDDSEFFHAYNRNKKSVALDLSREAGMAAFRDLVKGADAVASNLRGDVPDKLGLTYDALKEVNARIVCAHLSAYGRSGSRATWPGFDYLMQAEAGYLQLTGEPDGPPARFGLSVVDQMTGLALAYAVVAGVLGARASGAGRDMDVSLFDIALCNTCYPAAWYLNEGHVQERLPRSAHPSLTPCQLYRTRDGWIFLMCNKEKFWPVLCEALGRDDWARDPRFATFKERLAERARIEEMLDEALSARYTAEWLEIFAGRVPAAPIHDLAQALDNPFLQEQGLIQTIALPGYGDYRLVAPPVRASGAPAPARPAPTLGEHTAEVLARAGYDRADVEALCRSRAAAVHPGRQRREESDSGE